ncbi:helix-turn-helix domain-containing protein [Actinomyces denticolens]|uniref:helix-turn-helix domain-containing protein n=1 Tax=Actinomyces denticolens TaxID=52767 RepID=UPI0035182A6A
MSFDAAVGAAVNQYLLTNNLTRAQVGQFLGVAGSNISQRLRGRISWPAEDVFKLAQAFGVTVDDLMPSQMATDEGVTWVPAPYVPGQQKAPAPAGAGASGLVAGTGFEPATSGL